MVKCDKCKEELDFRKMRVQNFLETGDVAIKVWFVMEDWPSEFKNFYAVRREVRALVTDELFADRYIDTLKHLYEDRYLKSERPKIRKEVGYLDHLFAFSMDNVELRHDELDKRKLVMVSDRAWNEELGDIEIELPLTDKVVSKMLLKFGEKHKKFYKSSFIDTFELDPEQVDRVVDNLMGRVIKFERTVRELMDEEGK
jgi:hypothetical protein